MYTVKTNETELFKSEQEAEAYDFATKLANIHKGTVFTVYKNDIKKSTFIATDDEDKENLTFNVKQNIEMLKKRNSLNVLVKDVLNLTAPDKHERLLVNLLKSPKFLPLSEWDVN